MPPEELWCSISTSLSRGALESNYESYLHGPFVVTVRHNLAASFPERHTIGGLFLDRFCFGVIMRGGHL